ncbi:hypothetical protein [uncultured Clostridium sp.]|jgi:hypothetical protein|uniref:hypothetical protein n=1 Tax=uncultured Clostridium sp. TaxID=59620 RepID=UPI00262A32C2|nr:hypothetical protein [uncultured Clostridium sp.]
MKDIVIGNVLPEDFIGTTPEGLSGSFSGNLIFVLKMEDLTSDDVAIFNNAKMSFDLLELNEYKEKIGSIYAFSVLIDEFIDNSEVLIDFRIGDIKSFSAKEGIEVAFILADENDIVLGIKECKLGIEFSTLILEKAIAQNSFIIEKGIDESECVVEAFQKLFENEPEENLNLFSIRREVV